MSHKLVFSAKAWLKYQYFCHKGDTEIGAFGISSATNPLYVEDLYITKQKCSAAFVDFDDDGIADMFYDLGVEKLINPSRFGRIWLHTHPGSSAAPSGQDETTFKDSFGNTDWAVMGILSRTSETYARLRITAAGLSLSSIMDVETDWKSWPTDAGALAAEFAALETQWLDEYTRLVTKNTTFFATTTYYGGQPYQHQHDKSAFSFRMNEKDSKDPDRSLVPLHASHRRDADGRTSGQPRHRYDYSRSEGLASDYDDRRYGFDNTGGQGVPDFVPARERNSFATPIAGDSCPDCYSENPPGSDQCLACSASMSTRHAANCECASCEAAIVEWMTKRYPEYAKYEIEQGKAQLDDALTHAVSLDAANKTAWPHGGSLPTPVIRSGITGFASQAITDVATKGPPVAGQRLQEIYERATRHLPDHDKDAEGGFAPSGSLAVTDDDSAALAIAVVPTEETDAEKKDLPHRPSCTCDRCEDDYIYGFKADWDAARDDVEEAIASMVHDANDPDCICIDCDEERGMVDRATYSDEWDAYLADQAQEYSAYAAASDAVGHGG